MSFSLYITAFFYLLLFFLTACVYVVSSLFSLSRYISFLFLYCSAVVPYTTKSSSGRGAFIFTGRNSSIFPVFR